MVAAAIAGRFALVYLLATLAVVALTLLVQAFVGFGANVGAAVIPILVASYDAGAAWVRRTGEEPQGELKWEMAGIFTAIVTAFAAGQTGILLLFMPSLRAILTEPVLAVVAAAGLLVVFLVCRVFFAAGARHARRER
jgi:hypothetical protein